MLDVSAERTVEVLIQNGDCRSGAHQVLSLLAYPDECETEKQAAFCTAANLEYLRFLRRTLPPPSRHEVDWAIGEAGEMPAQQSRNRLYAGMRRVGWRIAAARLLQIQFKLTPSGAKRFESIGNSEKSLRVVCEDASSVPAPSVLKLIRDYAPSLRHLIALGARDAKASKNIQDRIVRKSLPVVHLSHALLMRALHVDASKHPDAKREHWAIRLLREPDWVRLVVPEAMSSRLPIWLNCRESNLIFPLHEMISVDLAYRQ